MEGRRIREEFLRFFEERGHKRVPSSSSIPPPESGLLLTNAGMNQFIPYFLGHAQAPFPRAVTVQKVFRAVDIDLVGHTARHLSLFEMLGNFSFGDYFKAESCRWGYELVTEVYGIEADRLWVTVFRTDDEAIGIWRDIGVPAERIVRRGEEDNFGGRTRPAPPTLLEIYVDRGPRYGAEVGPRSTRSATSRSGTTCSCRTRSTNTCGSRELRTRTSTRGPAWSVWPSFCRTRTTRSRPTCFGPSSRSPRRSRDGGWGRTSATTSRSR